jgi:hypothetical protein
MLPEGANEGEKAAVLGFMAGRWQGEAGVAGGPEEEEAGTSAAEAMG